MNVLNVVRRSIMPVTSNNFVGVRGMATGTVKWFNSSKGFGFIKPNVEEGPEAVDVFVHQTAIQTEGYRYLNEGEEVEFETIKTERGLQAVNVTGPNGAQLERN